MWKMIGKLLFWLGLGGLVLTLAGAVYLYLTATTVTLILPNSPDIVVQNQNFYNKGDNVAEIYGNALDKPTKVTLIDKSKIIHPKEDPTLSLYPVDKNKNENPLQLKSVWLFLRSFVAGFAVTMLLGWWLKRKKV
jgi:hypothetical protein